MCQMAASSERHAENRLARFQQREKHRLVRLRASMRLNIRKTAAEKPRRALDREALGDIDEFATTVIATSGIAFGVFVGERRALRIEHRLRDDVLTGDQLDLRLLAAKLARYRSGDLGIGGGQGSCKKSGIGLDGRPDSRGYRQDSTSREQNHTYIVPIRYNLPYFARQFHRATRNRSFLL